MSIMEDRSNDMNTNSIRGLKMQDAQGAYGFVQVQNSFSHLDTQDLEIRLCGPFKNVIKAWS
jgi:hypothetical protein